MTKLIEIFELTNPSLQVEDHIKATVVAFSSNTIMIEDVITYCNEIRQMLKDLTPGDSPYKLSNGNHKVDFLALMGYMKHGRFNHIVYHIRIIRSELILMMTQPGADIESLLKPLSFWDDFEAAMVQMMND